MAEIQNSYDLCRLCAAKLTIIEGVSIFEENNYKELHRKISSCLPIQVHISDKLPKIICLRCVYKLDELYDFREKCVHTERLLTGLLKHNDSLRQCETLLIVHPVIPLQQVSSEPDITLSPDGHLTFGHDRLNLQSNSINLHNVLPSITQSSQIQRLEINLSAPQNIEELGGTQGLDINEIDINQTMSLNNTNLEIIRNQSLEDELEFHNVLQGHSISSANQITSTVISVDDSKLLGATNANGIAVIKCEVNVTEDEDKCSERVPVKLTPSVNSINVVTSQSNTDNKSDISRDYVIATRSCNEKFQLTKTIKKQMFDSKLFGCNDCGKMCMELGELQDHFNICPPQNESSFCQNKLNSESQYNQCSPSKPTDTSNICSQNLLNDVNIQFIQKSPNNVSVDFSNRNIHERDHQYHMLEESRFQCQETNNTDNYDISMDSDSTIKNLFSQADSSRVPNVHTCTVCGLVCLGSMHLETHMKSVHNRKQSQQRFKVNFRKNMQHKGDYNSDEIEDDLEPLKEFDDEFDEDEEDDDDDNELHNENETEVLSNIQCSPKRKKWEPKVCKECGKSYRTNYKLTEHMRQHTGEKPYKCNTCDKDFRSKIGLAQHEAKHTGHYDFACETCGKGFQCKSYLIVHQRVHSDLKPYPCTSCNSNFKTKQAMLDHMNRHLGVKPYLCEICGRGFITKGLCKSHQRVHSGTDNRQFPCNVCQKMFVSKSYLATHLRIHTGEKPFACGICGKGFLTRVDLRIHSTMHTGEKNFVCEMCGKAFARRDALRCHRRSHTGERPYRCDVCGQSFTQFSPMAIHKRLHTGERPYNCDMCTRTFVSRSTMMSHKKKHSSDTF